MNLCFGEEVDGTVEFLLAAWSDGFLLVSPLTAPLGGSLGLLFSFSRALHGVLLFFLPLAALVSHHVLEQGMLVAITALGWHHHHAFCKSPSRCKLLDHNLVHIPRAS